MQYNSKSAPLWEKKGDGRGTATERQIYGGEGAEEMGERQMGDKAKWIQLLQTDFDKWHSDRETAEMHTLVQTHTHTHSIMQAP